MPVTRHASEIRRNGPDGNSVHWVSPFGCFEARARRGLDSRPNPFVTPNLTIGPSRTVSAPARAPRYDSLPSKALNRIECATAHDGWSAMKLVMHDAHRTYCGSTDSSAARRSYRDSAIEAMYRGTSVADTARNYTIYTFSRFLDCTSGCLAAVGHRNSAKPMVSLHSPSRPWWDMHQTLDNEGFAVPPPRRNSAASNFGLRSMNSFRTCTPSSRRPSRASDAASSGQ